MPDQEQDGLENAGLGVDQGLTVPQLEALVVDLKAPEPYEHRLRSVGAPVGLCEMLRVHQEPARWALLPEPDIPDGLGAELTREDGIVAQHGADHRGVGHVHGGALANGFVEYRLELGVGGAGVIGQGQVVIGDQVGSEDDAPAGPGERGEGAQVGNGQRVADRLEQPMTFAQGLQHGELHLGDEAGGRDDVKVGPQTLSEGLGGGFGVTDEVFGGELEPLPAIEDGEHARQIDRGVSVDPLAPAFWDAIEGMLEGDSVEIDQMQFAIVLQQGVELDVVAVAGTEDAERPLRAPVPQ